MKKFIVSLFLLVAVASASVAADIRSISLLAVRGVIVTNTLCVTNLVGATIGTNVQGTVYTNLQGSQVIVSAAGSGAGQNLLGQAAFYPYIVTPNVNSNGTVSVEGLQQPTYCNVSAKIRASSGANAAVTFTFVPVPDGANALTTAGEEWSCSFTAVASSTIVVSTNVPVYRWPGVQVLRLKRIVNADTDATSDVGVSDVYFNTFTP